MMKILRAPIRAGIAVFNVYAHAWRILTRGRPKPTLLDHAEFLQRFEDEMGGQGTLGAVDFKGSSECAPGEPLSRHHWQSAGIRSSGE